MSDERANGKVPPYLITTRDMIRTSAERWMAAFNQDQPRSMHHLKGARLAALDFETATRDDVKAIVGNDSLTRLLCCQCGQETDAVVVVGQELDWESRTAELCLSCLHSTVNLVNHLTSFYDDQTTKG